MNVKRITPVLLVQEIEPRKGGARTISGGGLARSVASVNQPKL